MKGSKRWLDRSM